MRYPKFLHEKGTIGFVAPSLGCSTGSYRSAFDRALEVFGKLGYACDLGPNCYAGEGIGISNTPANCGEELNSYFASAESDILLSCGGGELMCEVLDYVDFQGIAQHPAKWYMGYSDNTNMTFLLNTLCDTASVYGPCAPAFGMDPWHPSLQHAWEILTGKRLKVMGYDLWEKESLKSEENPFAPYQVTEKRFLHKQPEQDLYAEGRLLGGCMDCLVNLLGTKYDKVAAFQEKYKEDGIIWFLEACDLNVMSIRRAMWQMEHAGWFKYVKGFLIGRPMCFGEELMGLDQYQAVLGVISHYQVPVIMDVDLGHRPPMMPLISGSMAEIRSIGNDIEIKMRMV